ncbi:unnamed protein product [Ascophyllum nodosum]
MLDVSKTLEVPCVVTEQYSKALLHTVSELSVGEGGERTNVPVFEKKLFSMCTDEVMSHMDSLPKKPTDVVLFGIEAHVCVTQTCLDLLEHGYGVHIVCDGVSGQKPYDRIVGLQRMQQVGAFLTTAEQVAFQLAMSADNPNFKAISKLVKERNEEENAFSSMATL